MYPTEDLKSIQGTGLLKKVCDMKQSSSSYRRLYRLKVKTFFLDVKGSKLKCSGMQVYEVSILGKKQSIDIYIHLENVVFRLRVIFLTLSGFNVCTQGETI